MLINLCNFSEVKAATNFDLNSTVTPVRVKKLEKLLRETQYDEKKTKYLVDGFTNGFSIHYNGPTNRTDVSNNLKIQVGSKLELWNKVMTEVELKRYAGPYASIPECYEGSFIQSPLGNPICIVERKFLCLRNNFFYTVIQLIGLVRKAGFNEDGTPKTRLIFHLSHPRANQSSVNDYTDENFKHVKYKDLDFGVRLCLKLGPGSFMSKTGGQCSKDFSIISAV